MSLDLTAPVWLLLFPAAVLAAFLIRARHPVRSRKGKLSFWLHLLMVLLCVLAMSGLRVRTGTTEHTGWLLLDLSDSVNEESVMDMARQALEAADDDRSIGVIGFGREAQVLRDMHSDADVQGVPAGFDRSGSDLAGAIRLAEALTPEGTSGGIAVISDGLVSLDATQRTLPVNVCLLPQSDRRDAQVSRVTAPADVYEGNRFTVEVQLDATSSGKASLVLSLGGEQAAVREISLSRGSSTYVFELEAATTGVIAVEARVIMAGDEVRRNDAGGTVVRVTGRPTVLVVENTSAQGAFSQMLEASGVHVRRVLPAQMPESMQDYQGYQAVVLDNVDHDSINEAQERALEGCVRELGRGLCVLGGDSSYALGGYRGTLLESMLPVDIQVRNRMNMPNAALVLVIDKSGSMLDGMYGFTRIQMAREAACRALEVLSEKDYAGVIAFDDAGKWVVPLQQVTDIAAMQEEVSTIRAGGGTAFFTPLQMALAALESVNAKQKHVIFLTDGEAGDTGFESLVMEMAEKGITLTSVGVGDGVNTPVLSQLARIGKGRFYAAGPFDNLPKIFVKETMRMTESYVQNRTFTPAVTDPAMTAFAGFPVLTGYLGATEKAMATVSLVSDRDDPILASWQYGAGKVVSWLSDVGGAWSAPFIGWTEAERFFPGLVSYVLPSVERQGEIHLADGVLTYLAPETQEAGTAQAEILLPDQTWQTVTMTQVSGRRYQATGLPEDAGSYVVHVTVTDPDGNVTARAEGGDVIRYAEEYDLRRQQDTRLSGLSETSGGRNVEDPAQLLQFPQTDSMAYRSMQSLLLWALLAVLLLEVAQKRLHWESLLPETGKTEVKTGPKPVRKPKKASPGRNQPRGEITDTLYEQMQHRKRL